MSYYFDPSQSLFAATGFQTDQTLNAIVRRFVGNNPPLPMTYRAYSKNGIRRVKDYRYHADFNTWFPSAKPEQFVYAWAKYYTDAPADLKFDITCFSPLALYLNGNIVFKSDIVAERYPDRRTPLTLTMQKGWNHLVIRSKKTKAGFGGVVGTWLGKHPFYFLMPTPEREGQEGWIFSEPLNAELASLPAPGMSEADFPFKWLPERNWSAKDQKFGQFERLLGKPKNAQAVAWTSALFNQQGAAHYDFKGAHSAPIAIFIDDQEVYRSATPGKINTSISVPFGKHDIMIVSDSPTAASSNWGFSLSIFHNNSLVPFASSCAAQGTQDPWIYIGPFDKTKTPPLASLRDLNKVHPAQGGDTYWRVDAPNTFLRPYNENTLYGRWNYPLGVTLYGLLHAAKLLNSPETQQYIVNHMLSCIATFRYALWDKDQYGGATALHTLLSSIDSLDDCGSFGSVMLEVAKYFPVEGFREIADYVADYISNKQARLDDGTFYRKTLMHMFHENTMWADDLYMSVPFLVRYSQLTGEQKYLDDAARQFLGFKKRLYIPEFKIMSHIYDFRRDLATGIPWGRGNGWTIFSLSELLAVLPEDHKLRPELLQFFRDLCEGYLALQDAEGIWHQVLTHPDSYPETSCTAMFAYAFSRGIQYGWLKNTQIYMDAVLRAWTAINKTSIDKSGNVHGVCRGSEFSYSPQYYKTELLPNLNDTHGVGIVLLAGVETRRLIDTQKDAKKGEKSEKKAPKTAKNR